MPSGLSSPNAMLEHKGSVWIGAVGGSRIVIRLGDDLKPGDRVVKLWLQGPRGEDVELAKRVWIAAVRP